MARVMKVQKSEAIAHFQYEGRLIKDEPFGNGHINDTFLLTFELNKMGRMKAILQRMNNSIFEEPVQLEFNKVILYFVQDSFLQSAGKKVWLPGGMETEALAAYGKGAVKFEKYYSGSKDRECG